MTKEKWLNERSWSNERDKELAERAFDVLMGNVYPDKGFQWSPYRCITPGKDHFSGIWNWDSAFHAIGVANWDIALAKESILGFLQFQREDGLLPDVIWEKGGMVSSFSKPPVFAWASEIVYRCNKDIDFLKEVYPRLVRNTNYWMKNRCYKDLFFYNADDENTEDYLTRVKYESGWDNSVRWDKGITEYWAIDLNCFMVMCFRALSFMASELGLPEDSDYWNEKEAALSELINNILWDDEKKYYADVNRFTGEISDVLSPASFMPLYICIAPNEQADYMRDIAYKRFQCKMPTVPFDHPEYSNDYWRGPTWLNVAYFAAKGLKNYNFEIADDIKENILNMCFNDKRGIFENYDSTTEKGLCCDHFSWSSVFILEFILNW